MCCGAPGFRQDLSWIDLPVAGEDGWPLQRRGVVASSPGLYFVGLAFQYAFASMLIGGAGRDAGYVVEHLCAPHPGRAAPRHRGARRQMEADRPGPGHRTAGWRWANLPLPKPTLLGSGPGSCSSAWRPGRRPCQRGPGGTWDCPWSWPACGWRPGRCGRRPAWPWDVRTGWSAAGRTPSAATRCTSPGPSATPGSSWRPAPPGRCCCCRWCCWPPTSWSSVRSAP